MKTSAKKSCVVVKYVVWTVTMVSVWLAALASPPSDQNTVRVSSFGFDPLDSTRYIQAALDSGARTVVIDRQQDPWVVCPLFARSNSEIVLEEGVELVAKRGAFKLVRGNSLFSLEGVTNVIVRGLGSGATMRMWKKDYQTAPKCGIRRAAWSRRHRALTDCFRCLAKGRRRRASGRRVSPDPLRETRRRCWAFTVPSPVSSCPRRNDGDD